MPRNIIIIILFALLVAIFALQNAEAVIIKLFSWKTEVSLALLVLGALFLGALMVGLVAYVNQVKLQREIKKLTQEMNAESEVKEEKSLDRED